MEEIALVDLDDNITGYASKEDVHKKGLFHRAFSIYIVDGSRMLIQKRNRNKYHSGGLWTNACCSHQRMGEELEEAIHRRLKEELSFDTSLREEFSFIYRTVFEDGVIEYESDHVFLGQYNGEVCANPEEAEEVRWIEIGELKKLLETEPQQFTAWFIISAPRIFKILENNK